MNIVIGVFIGILLERFLKVSDRVVNLFKKKKEEEK